MSDDPSCEKCGCPFPASNCWDGVTAAMWQPIETAPKSCAGARHAVLVTNGRVVHIARRDTKHGWTMGRRNSAVPYVPSHWMPLPKPPKVG